MPVFTIVFLATLAASIAVRLWLSQRHARHVIAHRAAVPAAFAERVPLDAHQKAADYTVAKIRLGRIELAIGTLLLLAWTLGGGLELLDRVWQFAGWPALMEGTAIIMSALLIMGLLDLPLSAYRVFVLEEQFGFNRTSLKTFLADLLKGGALMLLLGTPLVLVVLWLMGSMGSYWWLYVWLVWTGYLLFLTWAFPVLIAPLFNRFVPLEDRALHQRIDALLARCGFRSQGIFVMDGSRRSGHGNAYFTGFGRNKRIVFFDTLLETLQPDQVEAVLAHELGHFKRRHVAKGTMLNAGVTLLALALLGWLVDLPWFYADLGVSTASTHMALLLFMLVGPVFGFFLHPILAWRSRIREFEADDFAAAHADGDSLIRALANMYKENASTLTPDPLHSVFYDSHPPPAIRIAHLKQTAPAQ